MWVRRQNERSFISALSCLELNTIYSNSVYAPPTFRRQLKICQQQPGWLQLPERRIFSPESCTYLACCLQEWPFCALHVATGSWGGHFCAGLWTVSPLLHEESSLLAPCQRVGFFSSFFDIYLKRFLWFHMELLMLHRLYYFRGILYPKPMNTSSEWFLQ